MTYPAIIEFMRKVDSATAIFAILATKKIPRERFAPWSLG